MLNVKVREDYILPNKTYDGPWLSLWERSHRR